MSGGFTPRHAQRNSLFFCSKAAPLASGRIVPRVTIAKGNSIHPTWDTSKRMANTTWNQFKSQNCCSRSSYLSILHGGFIQRTQCSWWQQCSTFSNAHKIFYNPSTHHRWWYHQIMPQSPQLSVVARKLCLKFLERLRDKFDSSPVLSNKIEGLTK